MGVSIIERWPATPCLAGPEKLKGAGLPDQKATPARRLRQLLYTVRPFLGSAPSRHSSRVFVIELVPEGQRLVALSVLSAAYRAAITASTTAVSDFEQ